MKKFKSVSSKDVDLFKYYNGQQRENGANKQLISYLEKLNDRLDSQERLIIELKEGTSAKKSTPKSAKKDESSDFFNFFGMFGSEEQEEDEEVQEEEKKEDEIPKYEEMNAEEIERYTVLFETNYKLLRKTYPSLIIKTPVVRDFSLTTIHIIYCDLIKKINIYQLAMKIKVIFLCACFGAEWYFNKKMKIEYFEHFTKRMVKKISKYYHHFISTAEFLYKKMERKWPTWMKFGYEVATSITSFIGVQFLGHSMNIPVGEEIINEVDRFISPEGAPFKYVDDGVPDVPAFQDTDAIINKIEEVIDLFDNTEKKPAATGVPVQEKDEKIDYNEVF